MAPNRHSEFNELGDISSHVTSAIGIVYRDRDEYLSGVQLVFVDEASVDGAAGAAAVKQAFGPQCCSACDRVQGHWDKEVILRALALVYDAGWFAEFVESLPSGLSFKSKLSHELISHFGRFVTVDPYGKGGVVVSCFANGVEHPVDLKGSHPLVRGPPPH